MVINNNFCCNWQNSCYRTYASMLLLGTGAADTTAFLKGARHQKSANAVFVDGHTGTLSLSDFKQEHSNLATSKFFDIYQKW